jgi:hypothetical protein
MNFREMRLLIALLVILGGGGGSLLVYQFFVKPLGDANTKIKTLKSAVEQKQDQYDTTMAERKLLERARLMSLSPNPHLARAEYDKYLYPLLVSCKLDIEGFSPTQPSAFKDATATQGGTALKPTHQILATEVKAKGDLESLVKAHAADASDQVTHHRSRHGHQECHRQTEHQNDRRGHDRRQGGAAFRRPVRPRSASDGAGDRVGNRGRANRHRPVALDRRAYRPRRVRSHDQRERLSPTVPADRP